MDMILNESISQQLQLAVQSNFPLRYVILYPRLYYIDPDCSLHAAAARPVSSGVASKFDVVWLTLR